MLVLGLAVMVVVLGTGCVYDCLIRCSDEATSSRYRPFLIVAGHIPCDVVGDPFLKLPRYLSLGRVLSCGCDKFGVLERYPFLIAFLSSLVYERTVILAHPVRKSKVPIGRIQGRLHGQIEHIRDYGVLTEGGLFGHRDYLRVPHAAFECSDTRLLRLGVVIIQ